MVFTDNNINVNNTTSSTPPQETDDISLFLCQLLNRSSSSSTPPTTMRAHAGDHLPCFPSSSTLPHQMPGPPGSNRLVVDRVSHDTFGSNLSAESLTGSVHLKGLDNSTYEYANDDCDYESEEGPDMVVEEGGMKRSQSRNQSKRSRAAEVHNLSEKRRRSRINEKMKALQNLIPNSNKTDKASMLDEAIEYLKQLQLQVQMLSMRNGLNLHPMCLPGEQGILYPSQLSQMAMQNLNNSSGSFDINTTNARNLTSDRPHSMFNLANECGSSARSSLPGVSTAISSQAATFGLESSIEANFQPFQLQNCIQGSSREQSIPRDLLALNKTETKSLVSTMPLQFDIGVPIAKEHNSLVSCTQQIYGQQEMLFETIAGQNQRFSSNFSGFDAASTSSQNDNLTSRR